MREQRQRSHRTANSHPGTITNNQRIKLIMRNVHLIRLFKRRHTTVNKTPCLNGRKKTPLLLPCWKRKKRTPTSRLLFRLRTTSLAPDTSPPKCNPATSKVCFPFQHHLARTWQSLSLASGAEWFGHVTTDMALAAFFTAAMASSLDRTGAVCCFPTRHSHVLLRSSSHCRASRRVV